MDSVANDYHPLFLKGIDEFNRRRWFDCHEVWEDLWIGTRGPTKSFYKGLIQAAVALYHLDRGNAHGAVKLLQGSMRYLEAFRPRYLGLDVDQFMTAMASFVDGRLARRESVGTAPQIHLGDWPGGHQGAS